MDDVFLLTDTELATRLQALREEADRRTQTAIKDAAQIIHGHEYAKRAIVVAAAGNHSILFVGGAGTGKTMLRGLAYQLGVGESYEMLPCPCGFLRSHIHVCRCTVKQIEKHLRGTPHAEINVEVCQVPEQEMRSRVTPFSYYADQLKGVKEAAAPTEMDRFAQELLKHAVSELGLMTGRRNEILKVAGSIAKLDHATVITSSHMAEAINYRKV